MPDSLFHGVYERIMTRRVRDLPGGTLKRSLGVVRRGAYQTIAKPCGLDAATHVNACFSVVYLPCAVLAAIATVFAFAPVAGAQLTPDQARRIDAALPQKARVAPKQPRQVLIWNTPFMEKSPHKGYTIPQSEYALRMLGTKTGAFEPVVSDDVAMYLPENLKRFDAIILNNSDGPWIRPTEKDMDKFEGRGESIDAVEQLLRRSLLDYVANGGGIVAYHYAIGANPKWPEFQELLGAGYWGHPWNEEVGVKLDEPNHPLLAAFGGHDFRIADEIFQYQEPYSREKLRVLLSLDVAKTNMTVPWVYRKDNDFALAWIKSHGQGRVFYSAIGHRTEIWWNPRILSFYLDGIQFATGDLPADTTPSAKVQEPKK
jgi:type 1 glutamine amidotransferase